MLILAAALTLSSGMATETPRIVTLPKRARPAKTIRKRVARKPVARKGATKPPVRAVKLCLTGTCDASAAPGYRLTTQNEPKWSGKMDVVKSTGLPCGVQGAPVCPKKGRELVTTSID